MVFFWEKMNSERVVCFVDGFNFYRLSHLGNLRPIIVIGNM